MKVEKKDLEKSQIELTVELEFKEFEPYIKRGAEKVSRDIKIEGFRPGKAPYEIVKQKIGEMTILEEAARIAINKTIKEVIDKHIEGQGVGQPRINITKLAPNNPMEYKVVLALLPKVALGDYKNCVTKFKKVEIKDEEIDKMIKQLQEMRAQETITERAVQDNDKVIVDIKMFLDNVPVEGGQGKDTGIIVGKGYIVPGFGKKLIGAKKEETREFKLPYPKDHHQKNLAGKLIDFKVKIKEVYERKLPEINDQFIKNFGLKSVEEFKDNIKKSLEYEKKQQAEQKTEAEMIDKIISKTKFTDIPEMLINNEAELMMRELEVNVARQGGKFEDYLKHLGKTREQLTLEMLPDAVKRVKTSLMIREVALAEKIEVSDKEVNEEIEKLLAQYKDNLEAVEKIKSPENKAYIKNLLSGKKTVDKLKEWNVET